MTDHYTDRVRAARDRYEADRLELGERTADALEEENDDE